MMLISLSGFGQSPVLVRLSNSPGPIIPGGHFTLFFDIKSDQPLSDSMQGSVILPDQWKLLSQRQPDRAAGQKDLRYFFVIGTPDNAGAGDFQIDFTLKSGTEAMITPVTVHVQEVRKLEIFVVSQPAFIREGDTLRVQFLVRNSGNKREKFALKTIHGKIENGTDSLILESDSQVDVATAQIIPLTDKNAWESSADLSIGAPGIPKDVHEVVTVPVFSSKIKKIDPYFRFPVEIGGGYLRYTYGGKTRTAYQYFANGKGYVDQKETHLVDFIVRAPNQMIFPTAGGYDQYSLEYQYKKRTFVSVGDYILQLSNLLEFGRFGRGVKLEKQFDKLGYTVFYQKARFIQNQNQALGGRLTYKMGRSFTLGINYESKNATFHEQRFWTRLAGITGTVRTQNMRLEAELVTGNARGKTDYGTFARLNLARKWVTVSGNFIYAGKNFYGFYHNSLLINSNIGFNITKKMVLGLTGNFSNINPSLDAAFYSISPKERGYTAFASYQLNRKNRFFAYYSIQERQDRQTPPSFHYSENFGNLSYHFDSNTFTLFYQGRYGYSRNHLVSDNTARKESISNLLQPGVRVFPWIWVGGYAEHQHTSKFSSSNVIENLFFYGGNLRVNIRQNLHANFLYRNNYAPDELYVRRSYLDASLLLDLKRHRITVSGGRSYIPNIQNEAQNTLFFTIRYALKLNVPLSRKRNVGTVRGRLTGPGYSKTGNLVQLGSHKFLTDSTGEFYFKGIAPDRYYLSVVQNESKKESVVPDVPIPMYLDVRADSVRVIDIPFTGTGSIIGKVDFIKAGQNGVSAALHEKPTILIRLSNETASLLTELTPEGRFSFKEMKPGKWNIAAFIPGNQDRFIIEDASRSLDIEINKTMDIVFRVKPNEKRIHFSERNFDVSIKK